MLVLILLEKNSPSGDLNSCTSLGLLVKEEKLSGITKLVVLNLGQYSINFFYY